MGEDLTVYPREFKISGEGYTGEFRVRGNKLEIKSSRGTRAQLIRITVENQGLRDGYELKLYAKRPHLEPVFFENYKVDLYPGKNRIRVQVFDEQGNEMALQTVVVSGPAGAIFKVGTVTHIVEGANPEAVYSSSQRSRWTQLIEQMNRFLEPRYRIDQVRFYPGGAEAWGGEKTIRVGAGMFAYGGQASDMACWHEAAHTFINQMGKTNPKKYKHHETLFRKLEMPRRVSARIFDESTYARVPDDWGHPGSDADEVFASASAVLRFFPDAFMGNAKRLESKQKEAVLEVARFVVNSYLEHPGYSEAIFDSRLVAFLGIRTKTRIPIVNEKFFEAVGGIRTLLPR